MNHQSNARQAFHFGKIKMQTLAEMAKLIQRFHSSMLFFMHIL
jgi:hypothetical protein